MMYLSVASLFFVVSTRLLGARGGVFTINDVKLEASLLNPVRNGATLDLHCSVDITKDDQFDLEHLFMFYKDEVLVYNVSSNLVSTKFTINPARVSSTGTYKCQVDVERKTGSKEISVHVTGVSPPTIHIAKSEVKEGEDVTVQCEALEEEPPLKFTFFKIRDSSIVSEKVMSARNKQRAEANFPVEKGDTILHFQCDVAVLLIQNERSNLSSSKIVTVTEPFSIPRIEVFPSSNFTEGVYMAIKCTVQLSPSVSDPVELVLQKDKHILSSSTNGTVVYSQLATVGHMGNYTCKAELKKAWKSSSVSIAIAELFARPRLTVKTVRNEMNEGDRLSLLCAVPGLSPEAAKNQNFYLLHGRKVKRQMKIGDTYETMVIEADSGSYVCEVMISNITKTSEPIILNVYAPVSKPVLTQLQVNATKVVLGDTLTLSCFSAGGTRPVTYYLYRGTERVSSRMSARKAPEIFTVNVTKSDGAGNYYCQAANRNTRSKEKQFSNIINVTVITPVTDLQLVTIPALGTVEEGSELLLLCSVGGGSFPIDFHFYLKKAGARRLLHITRIDSNYTSYVIPSFNKEEDGGYYCTASNMAGQQLSSEPVTMKAVLATWKKGILSAFIVFIIFAVIAIAVYFYLDKKRKGRRIPLEKSRSINSAGVNYDKATLELKNDDSYYGTNQNEEENHVLKNTDENPEDDQDQQEVEYTEVKVDPASSQRAPVPRTSDTVYSEIARSNHDADLSSTNMTTEDSQGAN
uniref:Platelet endothelial cell adhesion molecule n=1 Tax=Leptobrachium leishanense TaxID=445787 RepID=A0A8C5WLK8_9ANUR